MFGGSTVWGKGVDNEHTIPATLNALRPRFAVHNHGESAFVSRQGFERLVNAINLEEPTDVAVFYDGCNDFFTLCREDTSINGHSHEAEAVQLPSGGTYFNTGAWAHDDAGRAFTHLLISGDEPRAELRQWRNGASTPFQPG